MTFKKCRTSLFFNQSKIGSEWEDPFPSFFSWATEMLCVSVGWDTAQCHGLPLTWATRFFSLDAEWCHRPGRPPLSALCCEGPVGSLAQPGGGKSVWWRSWDEQCNPICSRQPHGFSTAQRPHCERSPGLGPRTTASAPPASLLGPHPPDSLWFSWSYSIGLMVCVDFVVHSDTKTLNLGRGRLSPRQ